MVTVIKHNNHSSTNVKDVLYTATTNLDLSLCTKCFILYEATIDSRLEWMCIFIE